METYELLSILCLLVPTWVVSNHLELHELELRTRIPASINFLNCIKTPWFWTNPSRCNNGDSGYHQVRPWIIRKRNAFTSEGSEAHISCRTVEKNQRKALLMLLIYRRFSHLVQSCLEVSTGDDFDIISLPLSKLRSLHTFQCLSQVDHQSSRIVFHVLPSIVGPDLECRNWDGEK